MSGRTYRFVDEYTGLVGFGLDRPTNAATLTVYLQQLADDELQAVLRDRLTDPEMEQLFDLVSDLLRKHMTEEEYHRLFLQDPHE